MNKKSLGTIALVTALVAVLAVPVLAEAKRQTPRRLAGAMGAAARVHALSQGSGNHGMQGSGTETRTAGQPTAQLEKRIANFLAARTHRFDAASANLNKRIDRLAALIATVSAAGGDVSGATADLDAARQHLATALSLEAEARALFQQVPTAQGRHAAFMAARAKGRAAVTELKLTRVSIRTAAASLRVVVGGLTSTETSETAD